LLRTHMSYLPQSPAHLWDVVIATDLEHENSQLAVTDELPLLAALEARGLRACRVPWNRVPAFLWQSARVVLIRSTWDYLSDVEAFTAWLEHVSSVSVLLNPLSVIKWNLHKRYLLTLRDSGIEVPPTILVEAGFNHSLLSSLFPVEWEATGGAVIKPAISAGADKTYRVRDAGAASALQSEWSSLVSSRCMLIQQYQPRISSAGELSLIFIAGDFTHAVVKIPANGDFRVQQVFGGETSLHDPTTDELAFARRVLEACPGPTPAYARVDIVRSSDGSQLLLMEVELLEPALWMSLNPAAIDKLASHVADVVTGTYLNPPTVHHPP
jgi:glutathione synthase/RimK-type ligase-like ATP-grasp enzyme